MIEIITDSGLLKFWLCRTFCFLTLFLILHSYTVMAQIDITRTLFTPAVVPETQTDPVRFEATVTGNPASVAFSYNGVDRPMFDNGTNGDVVAGDSTWTVLFTANEILSKNTSNRVFRPIIGMCKPAGGPVVNVIGEVWTSAIGLRTVQPINATGQETAYVANYSATKAQLLNFAPQMWAQRFYTNHGDNYDFINFVLVGGPRGNRGHTVVKNSVIGIGINVTDSSASYGSAGRLQGITTFPISSFYDGASPTFSHENGHQWINFLSSTPFAVGTPHWPLGNVGTNVMGISIGGPNGVGGNHPFTYTPNGSGGYVISAGPAINLSTFNPMELYLMGLASSTEVGTMFVLNNQSQQVGVGQTLSSSEITVYSIGQVIGIHGNRLPSSTNSQKNFKTATVVLSEQLLDARSISFYDFFTRRAESQQQTAYADGLVDGVSNPWFLATGGRSTMTTTITESAPLFSITGHVTTPTGIGIRNLNVTLTDPDGNRRVAVSSSFGVYTFDRVPAGANYTLSVSSKRYRFSPKVLSVSGNLVNVDFLGLE